MARKISFFLCVARLPTLCIKLMDGVSICWITVSRFWSSFGGTAVVLSPTHRRRTPLRWLPPGNSSQNIINSPLCVACLPPLLKKKYNKWGAHPLIAVSHFWPSLGRQSALLSAPPRRRLARLFGLSSETAVKIITSLLLLERGATDGASIRVMCFSGWLIIYKEAPCAGFLAYPPATCSPPVSVAGNA